MKEKSKIDPPLGSTFDDYFDDNNPHLNKFLIGDMAEHMKNVPDGYVRAWMQDRITLWLETQRYLKHLEKNYDEYENNGNESS